MAWLSPQRIAEDWNHEKLYRENKEKEIWNAAIEAAVKELEIINDIGGIFLIRKLKK